MAQFLLGVDVILLQSVDLDGKLLDLLLILAIFFQGLNKGGHDDVQLGLHSGGSLEHGVHVIEDLVTIISGYGRDRGCR